MPETCQHGSGILDAALIIGYTGGVCYPIVARLDECEDVEKVGRLHIIRHGDVIGGVTSQLEGRAFFDGEHFEAKGVRKIASFKIPLGTFAHNGGEVSVSARNCPGGFVLEGTLRDSSSRIQETLEYSFHGSMSALIADIEGSPLPDGWSPSVFYLAATNRFAE